MGLKENIKKFRIERNLTLEEVAEQLGVKTPTVQRYESGVISNIPSDKIEKLAEIFNILPSQLMGWKDIDINTSHWISVNNSFYEDLKNNKIADVKSGKLSNMVVAAALEKYCDFNFEEFKKLSVSEQDHYIKINLENLNPVDIIYLYFMDKSNLLTKENFRDFYKYITDYYQKLMSDFMRQDYDRLLDKIVKLQDIIKMQNELLNNFKNQNKKIENINTMLDELNILEDIEKDSLN